MKFLIISPSNSQTKWADLGANDYLDRISHFVKIEVPELSSGKVSRDRNLDKIEQESEIILKQITSDDLVVLLDEKGRNWDSLEWSDQIKKMLLSGKKRVVFVIGGAFGVSERIKTRANLKVSFGAAVLNHHLIKIVLLEQIYRGFTIINNLPYHNK